VCIIGSALGAANSRTKRKRGDKVPGRVDSNVPAGRKWFRQRLQTTCRQLITRRKLLTYARRRRRGRANVGTDVSAVGDPPARDSPGRPRS